jgi:hypothetical protein
MTKRENPISKLYRVIIQADLRADDYLIYVVNPRYPLLHKRTVAEWRKEGRIAKAFDRISLGLQLALGLVEIVVIPMLIPIIFSDTDYKWFFWLLLTFCVAFGPKQFLYGVASLRWLVRHSKKIPRNNLNGGW